MEIINLKNEEYNEIIYKYQNSGLFDLLQKIVKNQNEIIVLMGKLEKSGLTNIKENKININEPKSMPVLKNNCRHHIHPDNTWCNVERK